MADGDLRALEKRWRESGARLDEEAYQRARSRAGLPPLAIVLKLSSRFLMRRPSVDPGGRFDELLTELSGRSANLVLDGVDLRHVSSTELGLLVKHADRLTTIGGAMVVCGAPPAVRLVIEMLGLQAFFTLYGSVDQALAERGWEVLTTVEHVLETDD